MKAITIRQPWAWCISEADRITEAHLTPKLVDNRGRNISHRGPIAIHTAQAWDLDGQHDPRVQAVWDAVNGPLPPLAPEAVPHGCVVAVATLTAVHLSLPRRPDRSTCCRPWGDRLYGALPARHLELADVHRLPEPVQVRGRQHVPWTLPDDIATQVRQQLGEIPDTGGDRS